MRGLIHGNTGRPSHYRLGEVLRQKVLQLSRKVCHEFNDTDFAEKLRKEEGVANCSILLTPYNSVFEALRGSLAAWLVTIPKRRTLKRTRVELTLFTYPQTLGLFSP
jgi:hypothetical protein